MEKNFNVAVTPDGHKVGWDICGNPTCCRHISLPKTKECPNHPVEPAYLQRKVTGFKTMVEK